MVSRLHETMESKLSVREAGNISSLRASSYSEDKIRSYFNTLQKQFLEANIDN